MKIKALTPATLSLTLMLLAGCGQKNSETSTPATPEPSSPTNQATAPNMPATNEVIVPPAMTNS